MEVGGNNKQYPGRNLSNFFPHPFTFRGIEVASMEGFLQGLKFKSPDMQCEVFKLVGIAAKKKGAPKNWQQSQILWFHQCRFTGAPKATSRNEWITTK